jgi:hypothetical protein
VRNGKNKRLGSENEDLSEPGYGGCGHGAQPQRRPTQQGYGGEQQQEQQYGGGTCRHRADSRRLKLTRGSQKLNLRIRQEDTAKVPAGTTMNIPATTSIPEGRGARRVTVRARRKSMGGLAVTSARRATARRKNTVGLAATTNMAALAAMKKTKGTSLAAAAMKTTRIRTVAAPSATKAVVAMLRLIPNPRSAMATGPSPLRTAAETSTNPETNPNPTAAIAALGTEEDPKRRRRMTAKREPRRSLGLDMAGMRSLRETSMGEGRVAALGMGGPRRRLTGLLALTSRRGVAALDTGGPRRLTSRLTGVLLGMGGRRKASTVSRGTAGRRKVSMRVLAEAEEATSKSANTETATRPLVLSA